MKGCECSYKLSSRIIKVFATAHYTDLRKLQNKTSGKSFVNSVYLDKWQIVTTTENRLNYAENSVLVFCCSA